MTRTKSFSTYLGYRRVTRGYLTRWQCFRRWRPVVPGYFNYLWTRFRKPLEIDKVRGTSRRTWTPI